MPQSQFAPTQTVPSGETAVRPLSRPVLTVLALAASAAHALAMVPAYLAGEEFRWNEFAMLLAISIVVSVGLFVGAVRRGGSRTALVLASVAMLSIGAFWALLTVPLAAAAVTIALRRRDQDGTPATVALGMSAVAAALLIIAIGMNS